MFYRLSKLDLLIIDEISMVSGHVLKMINRLLQLIKGSEEVMGGVQRILSVDFLQFPPVPNEVSNDVGNPAILS